MLESLSKNESFVYAKLSPEEMSARGILGRLVGPCADFTIPTRNGRKYEEKLWENVFSDEIVIEKIANKCLFGELGHPADREEVDPEKIAIALNEVPKKNEDGQLIACFDILNTPCGNILKSLCDYGTTIGISSRGSGDLEVNAAGEDIVNPDTYCFECFDAVLLPAVKSARLSYMTESLDNKTANLKKALLESYNKASEKDKKIMKEAFTSLELLSEAEVNNKKVSQIDWDNIAPAKHDENEDLDNYLTEEDAENEDATDVEDLKNLVNDAVEAPVEDPVAEVDPEESDSEEPAIEEAEGEETEDDSTEVYTIGDLIKELKEFDKDLEIDFNPIIIDGVEYPIEMLSFDDASDDGKILINIDYSPAKDDNIEEVTDDTISDEPIEAADNAPEAEATSEPETAEDIGVEDAVVENLKQVIRQKSMLEQELKSLKNAKTVSDAEVKELKEDLEKYKAAFARTSELAGKTKTAVSEVRVLTEQLKSKEQEIAQLKEKNSISLNESVNNAKAKIQSLSNQLNESVEKLAEQEQQHNLKLNEAAKVAKQYKTKYTEALNKYISFRASLLGVEPANIISKLNKNYSFENIDAACDRILTESASINSLNLNRGAKVKITEQKAKNNSYNNDDLSDLYELAGLN